MVIFYCSGGIPLDSMINLEEKIKNLKKNDTQSYNTLNQIYSFYFSSGTLKIPLSFENKIQEYFGNRNAKGEIIETINQVISRIKTQKIVKTFNKWTGEGALFNSLRTSRPGMSRQNIEKEREQLNKLVDESLGRCDFCKPEKYTPEDVFGRVVGDHSITASNVAKYDVWSGLVIFRKHHPLDFNLNEISDYINTAYNWFQEVYKVDKQYKFPFFVWNCLYKAGASQVHGHAQVLMTQQIPYAKIEGMKVAIEKYKESINGDYIKDMVTAHRSLGLAHSMGEINILAIITPTKEKEVIIISPDSPSESNKAKEIIYNTLRCFIDVMGVQSFNFSISGPSMDGEYDIPYIMRLVDRGSLFKPTSDIGGMELFGSVVVGDDPYNVIQELRSYLK